jgi:hypothetical protein
MADHGLSHALFETAVELSRWISRAYVCFVILKTVKIGILSL